MDRGRVPRVRRKSFKIAGGRAWWKSAGKISHSQNKKLECHPTTQKSPKKISWTVVETDNDNTDAVTSSIIHNLMGAGDAHF
eukprot:2305805-Rhodomonas_salina.1